MRRMLKYAYRHLVPSRLMNAVDIFSSLRGTINRPLLVEKPAGTRILVLAPHPDDDIYGCGGVLCKHHRAGDYIVTVYMTDGRKGGTAAEPEEQVVLERRKESHRAASIIGIDRLVFLDNEDARLQPDKETISRLHALLKEVRPDIIYVPFLLDYHPDHIATNSILIEAMRGYDDFVCYGYEVWTPLLPNCFVDVSEHLDRKRSALEQFETQTKRFNMVGASLGLSKYRSVMNGHGDHFVESFFRCSPREYARLWELVKGK